MRKYRVKYFKKDMSSGSMVITATSKEDAFYIAKNMKAEKGIALIVGVTTVKSRKKKV